MTKDEALKLALEALEANYLLVNGTETHGGLEQCLDGYYSGCFDTDPINKQTEEAITAIKKALEQPEQEPVAMRMPKVGDKVICIEDDSLGEVEYLTAGGSPEIKFDDGSHGTYMLREFAELFRYATTPPQPTQVMLTDAEISESYYEVFKTAMIDIKAFEFAYSLLRKVQEK